MKKIEVVNYQESWKTDFETIKFELSKHFSSDKIEHVGSTSIPNLWAKPIIDIDIVIDDINELETIKQKLKGLGYGFEGDLGIKGRYAFKNPTSLFPHHHLYVVLNDGDGYLEHIAFRDYLLTHPKEIENYSLLKQQLANKFAYDRDQYGEGKTKFVTKILKKSGFQKKEYQPLFPNFNHSLINVTSSIQKHFGENPYYSTLSILDDELVGAKHVFLIVLDGMGKVIIEQHLPKTSFLRSGIKTTLSSLFPPTTVAVTTALESGLLPGCTGWVGWQQYFEEVNRNVAVFMNEDYYTGEKLSEVARKYIPYTRFASYFKGVNCNQLFPPFVPGGFESFEKMGKKIVEISKGKDKTYTYAYWYNPDKLIHEFGCSDQSVKECLELLDENMEDIVENCGKDTCLIVVADHGLIDTKTIFLNRFPELTKYFTRLPAVEGRATSFFVNDKNAFKEEFLKLFSSYFNLYSHQEFLEANFLGKDYQKAERFIGDFVAIAKDKYELTCKDESIFKATHAGMTSDEMIVPLIVFKK